MAIKKDTLDGLLAGRDPQAVFAKDGLFDELEKALAERVLNARSTTIWTALTGLGICAHAGQELGRLLCGGAYRAWRRSTWRTDRRR